MAPTWEDAVEEVPEIAGRNGGMVKHFQLVLGIQGKHKDQ